MTSHISGGNFGVKSVKFMYFSLFQGMIHTNYVYSNDDQAKVYQICKFHDPKAGVLVLGCGHINHKMKMHYFFKNPLLYSQA